jgi:hypothetical protein
MKMSTSELERVIRKHQLWLAGKGYGERADLRAADLSGAKLGHTDMSNARLNNVNLSNCELIGTNLTGAILTGADFTDANLTRANLTKAYGNITNFTRARLHRTNLHSADLCDANFTNADLYCTDLTCADLSQTKFTLEQLDMADLNAIKNDFWSILLRAQPEIYGLTHALKGGRIKGTAYIGDCACLVGTIANLRDVHYTKLDGIKPESDSPAERWFLAIQESDTPKNSTIADLTLIWIEEFLSYINPTAQQLQKEE